MWWEALRPNCPRYVITAPPTSVSVDLFVFNLSLEQVLRIIPLPMEITPPICPLISWCIEYDVSTYVCKISSPFTPIILGIYNVPFMYVNNLCSFPNPLLYYIILSCTDIIYLAQHQPVLVLINITVLALCDGRHSIFVHLVTHSYPHCPL